MKKTLVIGSVLVTTLLAGCSGTNNGGNADATSATSSSTTSTPSSVMSSAEATTADDSQATGSAEVVPAELDDQTKTWFTTMCGQLTILSTESDALSTQLNGDGSTATSAAAMSPDEATATQAAVTEAFNKVGGDFATAATAIGANPAPTIEGGATVADTITTALAKIGTDLTAAGQQFGATAVTDDASLKAAQTSLNATVAPIYTTFVTTLSGVQTSITPEIGAAVGALPGCENI